MRKRCLASIVFVLAAFVTVAVGDSAGTVKTVDTRKFWRDEDESPRSQYYHYHRNAETYYLVGEATGKAMVELESNDK